MYSEPTFGAWLKSRRRQLDLTQKSLAHQVGCSVGTIRKIEADERRPSRQLAGLLAECLDIPPDQREVFIVFARSEPYISDTPLPVLAASEDPIPINPQATKEPKIKHNLPLDITPFIGRVSELAEIRTKLMQEDCRLLTLLGPGGSGKTRLAIEAARGLLADFEHGIFFVNLAPLEETVRIPATIAAALNFSFYEAGTPEEQIIDLLGNKHMLLILDNFEHLLAGVTYVNQILNAAPGVKILVTSRARLMVTGEHLYEVWGMAYPESPVELEIAAQQYSAVKLFESGAQRLQTTFKLSDENISDVIHICALVEGLPLGIVLAASWVTMLTPVEIAMEIVQDLTFLEKDLQDLPERQRGMRSVFNHSWRLLSEREQKILLALSVFRGGFTREAVQAVVGASLCELVGLIDKSLLHRGAQGRFEIHELLRQFAAEKLAIDAADEITARDQHGNYFWQALANWGDDLEGPRQGIAMQEMTTEIDNIRAAWRWGLERTEIKKSMMAMHCLGAFYNQKYFFSEGVNAFHFAVSKLTPSDHTTIPIDKNHGTSIETLKLWIMSLTWDGFLNQCLGNSNLARSVLQKSLTLIENYELPNWDKNLLKAGALNALGFILCTESRDESIRMQLESVRLFKSLGLNFHAGYVLDNLGHIAKTRKERTAFFEESLVLRRKQGDLGGISSALIGLASEKIEILKLKQAEEMANEAKHIYHQIAYRHGEINATRCLGYAHLLQGNFQKARDMQQEILLVYHDLENTSIWAKANSYAGFPDLHMGNYDAACNRAYVSITICNRRPEYSCILSTALAKVILARVSLVKRSYQEAQQLFGEAISLFENLFNDISPSSFSQIKISQELANHGLANRGLGNTTSAKDDLVIALSMAIKLQSGASLVQVFPSIALLFADLGEIERAMELYALASKQGIVANSKWFADIAGEEIARTVDGLPSEVVEAAKTRGRELDLWATAEALLVELEQSGWRDADLVRSQPLPSSQ